MVMMGPPGMAQLLARMALQNPQQLATMAAAKGILPPGPGMNAAAPSHAPGAPPTMPIGTPAPGPTVPQQLAMSGAAGIGAVQPPTAAQGGGGGVQAPAPFIPGMLQPQTLDLVRAMMQAPQMAPNLGSLILGG